MKVSCPTCDKEYEISKIEVSHYVAAGNDLIAEELDKQVLFPCCQYFCGHCESINKMAEETQCLTCMDDKECCECYECAECGNAYNSDDQSGCDNCDACTKCCICSNCEYAGHHVDTGYFCVACKRCTGHCRCSKCYYCSERVPEEGPKYCHDCDHCFKCCGCGDPVEAKCGCTVKTPRICKACENCGNHCTCKACVYCDTRVKDAVIANGMSNPDTTWCSNCNRCRNHCHCVKCNNCENWLSSSSSNKHICGACQSCCTTCKQCNDCGTMYTAQQMAENDVKVCSSCGICNQSDRCRSRCKCNRVTPGWKVRGETHISEGARIPYPESVADLLLKQAKVSTIDPVEAMASFYLLDYATLVPPGVFTHRDEPTELAIINDEARALQTQLVDACDGPFRTYVDMAVGGELRHHPHVKNSELSLSRTGAWAQWRKMREIGGSQLLLDAAELFRDFRKTGYGGEPWAVITEVLWAREVDRIDPRTFVDRVFALCHNTGSLLNKIDRYHVHESSEYGSVRWKDDNRMKWGTVAMKSKIGPAHASKVVDLTTLFSAASSDARHAFKRYWTARNRALLASGQRAETLPSLILTSGSDLES